MRKQDCRSYNIPNNKYVISLIEKNKLEKLTEHSSEEYNNFIENYKSEKTKWKVQNLSGEDLRERKIQYKKEKKILKDGFNILQKKYIICSAEYNNMTIEIKQNKKIEENNIPFAEKISKLAERGSKSSTAFMGRKNIKIKLINSEKPKQIISNESIYALIKKNKIENKMYDINSESYQKHTIKAGDSSDSVDSSDSEDSSPIPDKNKHNKHPKSIYLQSIIKEIFSDLQIITRSNNNFIELKEEFDAHKLQYIINNFKSFKDKLRWRERYELIDPCTIIKKYLKKCRTISTPVNGVADRFYVPVIYIQKKGRGRFYAKNSLSLQNIPREIRHTISKDFFYDIDIANAHPVILAYLCSVKKYPCSNLNIYINNRDHIFKILAKVGISRDVSKQLFLSLTNGGQALYRRLLSAHKNLPNFIWEYQDEMNNLHKLFSKHNSQEYKSVKQKRKKQGNDFNHRAAYMNTILLDCENTLLMHMCKYFNLNSLPHAVLCHDGLMVPKTQEDDYDLPGCCAFIKDEFGINISLKIKSMDEGLDIPDNIPKYKCPSLSYYTDFKNIIYNQPCPMEWLTEWSDNSLRLIENNGSSFYLTKNRNVHVFGDKSTQIYSKWVPIKDTKLEKNLQVKILVYNPYSIPDYSETSETSERDIKKNKKDKKDKKDKTPATELKKEKKEDLIYFSTLGITNKYKFPGGGKGYLDYLTENRIIKSHNTMDFFPFLKRKGPDPLYDSFNIFTGYPLEDVYVPDASPEYFENSLFYKFLLNDVCSKNKEELSRLFDDIADMIQDGAQIKGPDHLFYGAQGTGKGLIQKFLCMLLGTNYVILITNAKLYFDKNFNSNVVHKILKVFEELKERGAMFQNAETLRAEQTCEQERCEPKGIDPFFCRHCARYWKFTNCENSTHPANDDRRGNFHKMSSAHANDFNYFVPLWGSLKDSKFLKSAFEFFANRKYDTKNVYNSYMTVYKMDQVIHNLPNGIKFILEYICADFNKIEDLDVRIKSMTFRTKYREWCISGGIKYNLNTLRTQISKIGIKDPKVYRKNSIKNAYYIFNTYKLQETMRKYIKNKEYIFDFGEDLDDSDLNSDFE